MTSNHEPLTSPQADTPWQPMYYPDCPNPDKVALLRAGAQVRRRLEADPNACKVPVETAEIWSIADFVSDEECTRLMAEVDRTAKPSDLLDQGYGLESTHRTSYSGDFNSDDPFVRMIERRIDDLLGIPQTHTGRPEEDGNDPFDLDDHDLDNNPDNDNDPNTPPPGDDNGQGVDVDREPLTSTAVITVDFHQDVPGKITFQNGLDIPLQTQLEAMGIELISGAVM